MPHCRRRWECNYVQDLREKIDQHYRVRLILDNLPITTYDLEENPESIRPGYEIGISVDGKYYLNNHLMFKILVHKTNGQYTRARKNMAELEAAAVVEVRLSLPLASYSFLTFIEDNSTHNLSTDSVLQVIFESVTCILA